MPLILPRRLARISPAAFGGDVEAGGAGGGVELVQVIGFDPGAQHGAEEVAQGFLAVIHPGEQDGLAEDGDAAALEFFERDAGGRR